MQQLKISKSVYDSKQDKIVVSKIVSHIKMYTRTMFLYKATITVDKWRPNSENGMFDTQKHFWRQEKKKYRLSPKTSS